MSLVAWGQGGAGWGLRLRGAGGAHWFSAQRFCLSPGLSLRMVPGGPGHITAHQGPPPQYLLKPVKGMTPAARAGGWDSWFRSTRGTHSERGGCWFSLPCPMQTDSHPPHPPLSMCHGQCSDGQDRAWKGQDGRDMGLSFGLWEGGLLATPPMHLGIPLQTVNSLLDGASSWENLWVASPTSLSHHPHSPSPLPPVRHQPRPPSWKGKL